MIADIEGDYNDLMLGDTPKVVPVLPVRNPQHTVARRTRQQLARPAPQQAVCIAGYDIARKVLHLHVGKLIAVVGLQGAVHTQVEQPRVVLRHAVHVVARQPVARLFFLYDLELITVVDVDAVAGEHPHEAVTVLKHLGCETARQLMVGIEHPSCLSCAVLHPEEQYKQAPDFLYIAYHFSVFIIRFCCKDSVFV